MTANNEDGYYWDEALSELIEEVMPGAFDQSNLTGAQWDELSKALNEHVSTARDFMAPVPSAREIRSWDENKTIASLRSQISGLEAREEVYQKSIRQAHHVGDRQYIEADVQLGRVVINGFR